MSGPISNDRRSGPQPRQRASTLLHLVVAWSFGFLLISTVALQNVVPAESLLLDRSAVSGGRWYQGMVTSLGVLAWTVAAVSCAGTAFVAGLARRGRVRRVFRFAALLLVVLLLDDLFLLHSDVVAKYLGAPKLALVGLEALGTLVWVATGVDEIRRTRWELLVAAGAGFGISVVVDAVAVVSDPRLRLILEDGAKFLGVLALAAWSVTTAADIIRSVTPVPAQAPVADPVALRSPPAPRRARPARVLEPANSKR